MSTTSYKIVLDVAADIKVDVQGPPSGPHTLTFTRISQGKALNFEPPLEPEGAPSLNPKIEALP